MRSKRSLIQQAATGNAEWSRQVEDLDSINRDGNTKIAAEL
jgi:hypothetical protein